MFLTGIDVIQYSKVANGHRCHVRFMVYDDAGSIYITYIVEYSISLQGSRPEQKRKKENIKQRNYTIITTQRLYDTS